MARGPGSTTGNPASPALHGRSPHSAQGRGNAVAGVVPRREGVVDGRSNCSGGYKIATELGVYAGRSVFPIALAIAANQGHVVYAVNTWDNAVATSAPISERDDVWWDAVDLVAIKSQFLRETISQNRVSLIKIIELLSAGHHA
jgi:hypothetical protein